MAHTARLWTKKAGNMFEIIPIHAQFAEEDRPGFAVTGAAGDCLRLSVIHENKLVWQGTQKTDDHSIVHLDDLCLPAHSGYLLQAIDEKGAKAQTAFDIASGQVRYGFLSDFTQDDGKDMAPVEWLDRLHINYIQFYDWAYLHDRLVGPVDDYTDMMGKRISRRTVRTLIDACHTHGMNAMAYGAIYGSSNGYAQEHPDYRLYDRQGKPVPFADLLSIMNVDRGCGWHDHILQEYQKALDLGFDGIHMDTYGFPTEANDSQGRRLDLARNFRELVDDAKAGLRTPAGAPKLIFNNVKNWPVDHLATAHQDALYIEVWDPYSTYTDILGLIEHARSISDLPVILAAYLPQFEQGGSEQAYNALAILTAIITVAGATHLINGQDRGLLTQAYYSKYFTADKEHARQIISYYDYITYLSGLWADRRLRTIPLAAERQDGNNLIAGTGLLSDLPQPGKIWIRARRDDDRIFLNFVNLTGSQDPKWTHGQNVRDTEPFTLLVRTDGPVSSVTYSTPDNGQGIEIKDLDASSQTCGGTVYTRLRVPSLHVWGSVIIHL